MKYSAELITLAGMLICLGAVGLVKFNPRKFAVNCVWGVHTKYGYMCSFSFDDILTYMGDGIWDLRVAKEDKLTDEEEEKPWL